MVNALTSNDPFTEVLRGLTEQQQKEYWANRYKTRKLLNVPKGWHLHHKDPTLIYTNIERYIQWRPEDLVILSASEHTHLHNLGKDRTKCNYNPEKHRTAVGRRWVNDGEINRYLHPGEEIPEGFSLGRIMPQASLDGLRAYKRPPEKNPMKRPEVRAKVSATKKGSHRVYREDGSYYYQFINKEHIENV